MSENGKKPRILLLEDDSDIRDLLTGLFNLYGCETLLAASQTELDAILDEGDIDLALLDIMLPGADGRFMAREIRNRGFVFPMYFMTGVKDAVTDEYRSIVDGVLCKPFTVEELQETLGQHLHIPVRDDSPNLEQESLEMLASMATEHEALKRQSSRLQNLTMVLTQMNVDDKITTAFEELSFEFDSSLQRLVDIMDKARSIVDRRMEIRAEKKP